MPFIEVNGANIYYNTFGVAAPGVVPILLIHGSTGTGRSNWELVAPLLARRYFVIAPDCRGHGQSSNPNRSYSFKEMADDNAGLIHALGFERVHLIGHSNGGNVALVALLEHPEVIQTAVLQAANAWVSPDLPEIEPGKFDPDRVAAEDPTWMNDMIALHGSTHGPDYWRDLLKWTVRETITQPNYTVKDLKAVRRPTLVIQGEKDNVNAFYRHAQFIAYNIPDAEIWIPQGIGHSVHKEILFQWIDRVLDFLERRGSDVNDTLHRLGRQAYPDKRLAIFDLRAGQEARDEKPGISLKGRVLSAGMLQAALEALPAPVDASEVKVMLDENTPCALVKRGVNDVRRGPDIFSERISQALSGEIVHILEERANWAYIQLDHDGYLGWVQERALHRCSFGDAMQYQEACNGLVCAEQVVLSSQPGPGAETLGRLPFGVSVHGIETRGGYILLDLPGVYRGWIPAGAFLPLSERPRAGEEGIRQALEQFKRFIGVPYLWGGRTPFGFDCSGLAQAFMRYLGVSIPRDADEQYRVGSPFIGDPRPGDLLFFGDALEPVPNMGTPEPGFTITHVAISLGGDEYLHSNGATWSTAINSFNPQSPVYRADLRRELVGMRRFIQ